jgi:transcriptional regulator with XRE-family HTH domain
MYKAVPATPEQILMYGHISIALRNFLDKKGWKAGDLNQAIGLQRSNTGIYGIINGKFAPDRKLRRNLAKATGIPEEQLTARKLDEQPKSSSIVTAKRPYNITQKNDVLSFVVGNDGMATIKLSAVLPVDTAMPLLRMLLDAGVVFKSND